MASSAAAILVADDDSVSSALIKRSLSNEGYSVSTVNDGDEAIIALNQRDFAVVITDIFMPRTNGLEVLRALEDHVAAPPVVLVTACASLDTAIDGLRAGAFDYLVKPFSPEQLLETVHRAIACGKQGSTGGIDTKHDHERALGRITAGVVHEMKNSLGSVRGLAELISMKATNDSVLKFSDRLMSEVDRFNRTLDFVYRFAKTVCPSAQGIHVAKLIDDIVQNVTLQYGDRHVVSKIAPILPNIRYDRLAFTNTIESILENAYRATNEGDTISLIVLAEGDNLVIHCADQGCGMPSVAFDRAFEPFYSTWKHLGAGLGLTIARRVIEAHGGTIDIDTKEGSGTVVTMTFPAQPGSPYEWQSE